MAWGEYATGHGGQRERRRAAAGPAGKADVAWVDKGLRQHREVWPMGVYDLFLASDRARFITGAGLPVDGGMAM